MLHGSILTYGADIIGVGLRWVEVSEFVGEFVDGAVTNRLCRRKTFGKLAALGLTTMHECCDVAACDPSVATYSVRRDQAFIEELVQVCDSCQAVLLLDSV